MEREVLVLQEKIVWLLVTRSSKTFKWENGFDKSRGGWRHEKEWT